MHPNDAAGSTVLAGDDPDAFNDVERPDRVSPITTEVSLEDGHVVLPPHSLTIIAVAKPSARE